VTGPIPVAGNSVEIEARGAAWSAISYELAFGYDLTDDAFLNRYRDVFARDISTYTHVMEGLIDTELFRAIPTTIFTADTIELAPFTITAFYLDAVRSAPAHLVLLRAAHLAIFNWCFAHKFVDLNDPAIVPLCRLLSAKFRVADLQHLIRQHSKGNKIPRLEVARMPALEVREGRSDALDHTFVRQVLRQHSWLTFRVPNDRRPWRVDFAGEKGIDAGGLARELASELAADICAPCCGLVVETPNARAKVGGFRDCVVPFPSPRHKFVKEQLQFVGALIGICARSGLAQDFRFPPVIWDFLASGTVTIEHIFEIDQNYAQLISSLREALDRGMDADEFRRTFRYKFVVTDITGREVPLNERGRSIDLTIVNCREFISLANEFRVGQLKEVLWLVRDGLWTNFGFKAPPRLPGLAIEFCACGEKVIDVQILQRLTVVEIPKEEGVIFWRVVEALSQEERAALLKFATGVPRIPPHAIEQNTMCLKLDRGQGRDRLPCASTCFYQLHMPVYTSFENALKFIRIAITSTLSFENQ
jgi:hypothetical protein